MNNTHETPSTVSEPKRRGRFADFLIRLWREKPLGTACGMIIFLFIVVAIFADVLAPHDYRKRYLPDRLTSSSTQYLLGTDHLGRDLLSRLIVGARILLTVGLAATALNVIVAVLIGGTFGFLGGKPDLVMQRFVDVWMAFPGLLLLLTVMSIVGQGLLQICGPGRIRRHRGSRTVRSAVIGVKENDYFLAAKAVGTPTSLILIRHVLPNIMAPIIIIFSINIRRHHCRGVAELPRIRAAHRGSQLGGTAQPGRTPVHGASALAGLAWAIPDDYRLLPQSTCFSAPRGNAKKASSPDLSTRSNGKRAKGASSFSFLRSAVFSSASSWGHLEESARENVVLRFQLTIGSGVATFEVNIGKITCFQWQIVCRSGVVAVNWSSLLAEGLNFNYIRERRTHIRVFYFSSLIVKLHFSFFITYPDFLSP